METPGKHTIKLFQIHIEKIFYFMDAKKLGHGPQNHEKKSPEEKYATEWLAGLDRESWPWALLLIPSIDQVTLALVSDAHLNIPNPSARRVGFLRSKGQSYPQDS